MSEPGRGILSGAPARLLASLPGRGLAAQPPWPFCYNVLWGRVGDSCFPNIVPPDPRSKAGHIFLIIPSDGAPPRRRPWPVWTGVMGFTSEFLPLLGIEAG